MNNQIIHNYNENEGFVLSQSNKHYDLWELTDDFNKLMESDDVIIPDDDVKLQFLAKFPDEGIQTHLHFGEISKAQGYVKYVHQVYVFKIPYINSSNVSFDDIEILLKSKLNEKFIIASEGAFPEFIDGNDIIKLHSSTPHHQIMRQSFHYYTANPQKVQKVKIRKSKKIENQVVRPSDFMHVALSLRKDFDRIASLTNVVSGNMTMYQNFIRTIAMHTSLFGKNSYRKNKDFQELLDKWRSKSEKTYEKELKLKLKEIQDFDNYVKNNYMCQNYINAKAKDLDQTLITMYEYYRKSVVKTNKQIKNNHENKHQFVSELFKWMDEEIKVPKPKSYKLKNLTTDWIV